MKDKNQFFSATDDNVTANIETIINNNNAESGKNVQNVSLF